MANFEYETRYWNDQLIVAGSDEAGRGSLAGPVVAAAVIFEREDDSLREINDSKLLSSKKRDKLFQLITENALTYSICFINQNIIDEINILNAAMLAMKNAIVSLEIKPDISLIDGNRFIYNDINHLTIIKGDSKSISIAASSILAKVARDKYMVEQSLKYPHFRFERNKGYGTKEHIQAIDKHGTCELHRRTFLNKITERIENENTYNLF